MAWGDSGGSPYLHRLIHFGDGVSGDGAGLLGPRGNHLVNELRLLHELAPLLPDRREAGDQRVREQAFAVKAPDLGRPALLVRSEERRVGKECRSRWSPYH